METSASSLSTTFNQHHHEYDHDGRFLREADAWAITTTWHKHLRGADIALVCEDVHRVTSIVENYRWIYLRACLASHQSVSVARAAVLTWRAVSRCTGYGVEENAVFWRRVFSFLSAPDDEATVKAFAPTNAVDATDAIRFFGGDSNVVFPRIMVAVHGLGDPGEQGDVMENRVRELCGLTKVDVDGTALAKYDLLLATLRPFHTNASSLRPIDVCLDVTLGHGDLAVVLARLRHLLEEMAAQSKEPCLRIRQIQFSGTLVVLDVSQVELLDTFLRDDLCLLGGLWVGPPSPATDTLTQRGQYVRAVTGVARPRPSQPHRIAIQRPLWSNHAFEALMSALPFATSVHSVQFSVRGDRVNAEAHDLPWLAYALFHPHAARSSWRHLDLLDLAPRARTWEIFQAMARGNNLLALLVGAPTDCTAYYSTQLPRDTPIKSQPRDDAHVLMATGDDTGSVDLCVASPDASHWSEWVAVIVAGVGVGWVRSYVVHSVATHAPSPSPALKGLRVTHAQIERPLGEYAAGSLVYVLRALGAELTYLHMAAFGEARPPTVHLILSMLCPKLTTLVCSNDGSLLRSSKAAQTDLDIGNVVPHNHGTLRELELHLSQGAKQLAAPSELALRSWLVNLRALRIAVTTPTKARSLFQVNREAIRTVLRELVWLQYLHWDEPSHPPPSPAHRPILAAIQPADVSHDKTHREVAAGAHLRLPTTRYDALHAATLQATRSLELPPRVVEFAVGAMTLRCRRALLSVARRADARSPTRLLDRMDEAIFRTIFGFATTAVPRELCFVQA